MSDRSGPRNLSKLRDDPTYAQGNKGIWNDCEILSEICEDPAYASPTYARFTVYKLSAVIKAISTDVLIR